MTATSDKTAIRDAATVIVLRDRATDPHVLMGQRGATAAFMPNKFVFPGGAVDAGDAHVPLARPLPATIDTARALIRIVFFIPITPVLMYLLSCVMIPPRRSDHEGSTRRPCHSVAALPKKETGARDVLRHRAARTCCHLSFAVDMPQVGESDTNEVRNE